MQSGPYRRPCPEPPSTASQRSLVSNDSNKKRSPGGKMSAGSSSPPTKKGLLEEPLLEVKPPNQTEQVAMILIEALHLKCFDRFPEEPGAWPAYYMYSKLSSVAYIAIFLLLSLTAFEAPSWCDTTAMWDWRQQQERCLINGVKSEDIIMSGIPILSIGAGLIIEYLLYSILMVKLVAHIRVQRFFRRVGHDYSDSKWLVFECGLVVLGMLDCLHFTFHQKFRVASLVRCGLALCVPSVRHLAEIFYSIVVAISQVGLFLLGSIMIFAWLAALMFNDLEMVGRAGPVNNGFTSYSAALYTAFVASTTANLPDCMVPTYEWRRSTVWLWMIFFMFAVVIFTQVVLAVVYNKYSDVKTEILKHGYSNRETGIVKAFNMLKIENPKEQVQPEKGNDYIVEYSQLEEVLVLVEACDDSVSIDKSLFRVVYDALDDDGDGVVTYKEFEELCDVIQYSFVETRRDSWVRTRLKDRWLGQLLPRLMHNSEKGPDLGYEARFPESMFDKIVKVLLATNVGFVLMESVFDLNDIPEPELFPVVEQFFSFIYLFDVGLKLCWWSFPEYWHSIENRVDFITTMMLAVAGISVLFGNVKRDVLRALNMLRLVRLLKAFSQVSAFQETFMILARMVTTCQDVLLMNFLVVYLWAALGVQLFGGELYRENPKFDEVGVDPDQLDYFMSNFQVYNFNDVPQGVVTLFFFVITGWVDQVAAVCLSLSPFGTPMWWASNVFLVSFYIASPLITFNLFTAFAIDVYCKLQEYAEAENKEEETEVYQNLKSIVEARASEGRCLHVMMTAALRRAQVYRDMFEVDDEDEDEEGEERSKGDGDEEVEPGGDEEQGGGKKDADVNPPLTSPRIETTASGRSACEDQDEENTDRNCGRADHCLIL